MTVCLAMIARDEAEVIERCLRSAIPLIDTYLVVDTGSTDETKRIVAECLDGLPGDLAHKHPDDEIVIARRSWANSQAGLHELASGVDRVLPGFTEVGWHDTAIGEPERGAIAVVSPTFAAVVAGHEEGPDDLVGEILNIKLGTRSALVYVVSIRSVPTPISLSRRAFLALAPLWTDSIQAQVEVRT